MSRTSSIMNKTSKEELSGMHSVEVNKCHVNPIDLYCDIQRGWRLTWKERGYEGTQSDRYLRRILSQATEADERKSRDTQ